MIWTPDQRLRVFISSTLKELGEERNKAREAVRKLHLTPILFEQGARPHSPNAVYRAYLDQSHIFVGIYWQEYGWVAPGTPISGIEDEYRLAEDKPRLIYVREPAPKRDPRLTQLLDRVKHDGQTSYKRFGSASELEGLIGEDLAILLSERFGGSSPPMPTRIRRGRVGGVPVPVSRFIGREPEIQTLRGLLERTETRLVTLTGLGGIGKTRLALKVATDLHDRFPDGVTVVSLEDVAAESKVFPTIVEAFGLPHVSDQAAGAVLEDHLHTRDALLVLDSFDRVVGAAPGLATLLERCPRLKVLVTSREVLRISGEQVLGLPPLPVPTRSRLPATTIGTSEAVRLFVDRAQAAGGGFNLDDANAPVVAEIVRRLDGLPLAIELAAARIRVLTPAAILQRLESRLGILTSGSQDLPERQRTLRNTIDWSYGLLAPNEKAVLGQIGVFVGGWTLDAAEAVCGLPEADVIEALSALIDKSLVQPEGFVGNALRFGMLEIVREYALERLADRGEVDIRRHLHAAYFVALAERAAPERTAVPQEQWVQRFIAESGNIRAAMAWLHAHADFSREARLGWALWNGWWLRTRLSEAAAWMETVVAQGEFLAPLDRARASFLLGVAALGLGDNKRAVPNLETANKQFGDLGDRHGEATALSGLGLAVAQMGNPMKGEEILRQALVTFDDLKDPWPRLYIAFGLGEVLMMQGRDREAIPLLKENVARARDAGEKMFLMLSLHRLAWAHMRALDDDLAKSDLLECIRLAEQVDDLGQIAWVLDLVAALAAKTSNADRGAILLGAAEGARRSVGEDTWVSEIRRRDRTRQALLDAMGPEGFSATLAEGMRIPIRDALELATVMLSPSGVRGDESVGEPK